MTNVLAIDQGTSGTKAIVADDAGQVLAIAEQPLHPLYLDGGGVEQDPGALLDSVLPRDAGPPPRPASRWARSPWPTRARPCWPGTAPPAARSARP